MGWDKTDPETFIDSMPVFITKPSEDYPGWLLVTCPRTECGQLFLVKKASWYERHLVSSANRNTTIVTRPCPYCFKASKLPRGRRAR
jgi:hypothetical protein